MASIYLNAAQTTGIVRTTEAGQIQARGTRDGGLVVADWKQALMLEGRAFQMQLGTEDAPIDSTTSIDDQLVWGVVDVPSGTTAMPFFIQAVVATWTTSTLLNFMIELDKGKVRYSSGGTAFTPLPLRTDGRIASSCSAYVGTDVTVAAKTASGSLEVYRQSVEVNFGNAADAIPDFIYEPKVVPVVVGPGSILFHFGAATADATAYGVAQWFEVPTTSIT